MNDPRIIGQRIADQRHLLEYGPSSLRTALELARSMLDEMGNQECPEWANHRTIGAVIHCAELAAGRIERSVNMATGWGDLPD
jgi:hypothetical protein